MGASVVGVERRLLEEEGSVVGVAGRRLLEAEAVEVSLGVARRLLEAEEVEGSSLVGVARRLLEAEPVEDSSVDVAWRRLLEAEAVECSSVLGVLKMPERRRLCKGSGSVSGSGSGVVG